MLDKLVIVTRKTRLQELVERFNTRAQAKFYIEHAGNDFGEYEREEDAYRRAVEVVHRSLDVGLKQQTVDRALVPTLQFDNRDLVVAVGQDGLVANVAKYIGQQPLVAVNPDPERFDGLLLPFTPDQVRAAVLAVLEERARVCPVTLAEARLADGQRLLAFNDLFIGAASHISARYRIRWQRREEPQSSSGVIVSTGAGSTGWLSSVFNMAAGVAAFSGGAGGKPMRLGLEDPRLVFVVREPFVSRHSTAAVIAGLLHAGEALTLESEMPCAGTIFSDGVETDFLPFNSGAVVQVRAAAEKAQLVVGS